MAPKSGHLRGTGGGPHCGPALPLPALSAASSARPTLQVSPTFWEGDSGHHLPCRGQRAHPSSVLGPGAPPEQTPALKTPLGLGRGLKPTFGPEPLPPVGAGTYLSIAGPPQCPDHPHPAKLPTASGPHGPQGLRPPFAPKADPHSPAHKAAPRPLPSTGWAQAHHLFPLSPIDTTVPASEGPWHYTAFGSQLAAQQGAPRGASGIPQQGPNPACTDQSKRPAGKRAEALHRASRPEPSQPQEQTALPSHCVDTGGLLKD